MGINFFTNIGILMYCTFLCVAYWFCWNTFFHSHIIVLNYHDNRGFYGSLCPNSSGAVNLVTCLNRSPSAERHVVWGPMNRSAAEAPTWGTWTRQDPTEQQTTWLKEQEPAVIFALLNCTFSGPWKQIRHCGDRIPLSERLGREAASRLPPLGLDPSSLSSNARLRGRGSAP